MGITPFTGALKDDILRGRREYFKNQVKQPLREIFEEFAFKHPGFIRSIFLICKALWVARRYPEPTLGNVQKHNSKILLRIWDRFLQYEDNPNTEFIFSTIRRVMVDEYEHDDYESQRMDWFLEELVKAYNSGDWRPQAPWYPFGCWTEPEAAKAMEDKRKEMALKLGIWEG